MKSKLFLFNVVMLLFTSITAVDVTRDMDFEIIDKNFSSPPFRYRMLNYPMNKDLDNDAADQLLGYGFGGVMTSTPYNNYLQSTRVWDQFVQALELAGKKDMYVWLTDERGYPSGAAGGVVVAGSSL